MSAPEASPARRREIAPAPLQGSCRRRRLRGVVKESLGTISNENIGNSLDATKANIEALSTKIDEEQEETISAINRNNNSTATQKIYDLSSDVSKVYSKLDDIESEISSMESDVDSIESNIRSMESDISSI